MNQKNSPSLEELLGPPVNGGIEGLTELFGGLLAGDNVVFRVDHISAYVPYVQALVDANIGRSPVVYFRFGAHEPILAPHNDITERLLHPDHGFDAFITEVHNAVAELPPPAIVVFDSLSDLSASCYSDRMIGNFFKITCPYLLRLKAVAYFTLYRHQHSFHAVRTVEQTTQVMLDLFSYEGSGYVKPVKADIRPTARIGELFRREQQSYQAVVDSTETAAVLRSGRWHGLPSASYRMVGVWDKLFVRAEAIAGHVSRNELPVERKHELFTEIARLVISRDPQMLELTESCMSLDDLIAIWKRMIGTGMIGGKSVGMLLARAMLTSGDAPAALPQPVTDTSAPDPAGGATAGTAAPVAAPSWAERLEEHDSFYIGSDVFYTYLVENDCWWARRRLTKPETFLDGHEELHSRLLVGKMPDYIVIRLREMLEYFGNDPIIVRSSSLLEDAFGNAFAGKYDSVFCPNQGDIEERLERLLSAIRTVYASAVSAEALKYRKARGVLQRDEQMALLVQRVSGTRYGRYFLPQSAGVLFSFNPYVWHNEIRPEDGVLRLVFGLGTRAVDRSDDDYTRVVALGAPTLRPEGTPEETRRYSQKWVDVIDLEEGRFRRIEAATLLREMPGLDMAMFVRRDREAARAAAAMKRPAPLSVDMERLLSDTTLVSSMREIITRLRQAYRTEIDLEFTANIDKRGRLKIDILQCRPLQVQTEEAPLTRSCPPPERCLMYSEGGVVGRSREVLLDWILHVPAGVYSHLGEQARYALARRIGRLLHHEPLSSGRVLLIGPGRWGTSTPSLGVPVSFGEISTAAALVEIDEMHQALVPDLSLGTHFFHELVELDLVYLAFFSGREPNHFARTLLTNAPNRLAEVDPGANAPSAAFGTLAMPAAAPSGQHGSPGAAPGTAASPGQPTGPATAGRADPAPLAIYAADDIAPEGLVLQADALSRRWAVFPDE
ncbi:MAG: pyruvate, phosphate dikinase [Spirochaetaceae bacterium]|nr:MAG: pyruvate, phosphate dikinase [Spirochaetaceae bacterium]